MDPRIEALKSTTFSGRRLTRCQIAEIRDIVEFLPGTNRNRLCRLICEQLNWVSAKGELRIGTCLSMLEKLERHGILTLPPKVESNRRRMDGRPVWPSASGPQPRIEARLADLRPLRLVQAEDAESRQLWNALVDRHHYLGYKRPFGSHIRYFVHDRGGRRLACLLFDSSTRTLPCRDAWIGWSGRRRDRDRVRVVCNSRFLILPWVRSHNLASACLGMAARQLPGDWERRFGTRPLLAETYVDTERFRASCYRAANWLRIGETAGGWDKPRKAVFVLPLAENCRAALRGDRPPPQAPPAPAAVRDTRFARLWRDIADLAAGVASRHDRTWQKRRRVFSTLLIILFVFRLVLSPVAPGIRAGALRAVGALPGFRHSAAAAEPAGGVHRRSGPGEARRGGVQDPAPGDPRAARGDGPRRQLEGPPHVRRGRKQDLPAEAAGRRRIQDPRRGRALSAGLCQRPLQAERPGAGRF